MRRSAVFERGVQRAELRLEVVLGIAGDRKRLDHDIEVVVTHSAGTELHAVAHDVVLVGEDVAGILLQKSLHTALRHRERVVGEYDLTALFILLEHREIHDEAELEAALVDKIEPCRDLGADLTGELGSLGGCVGDEVDDVARLGAVALYQLFPVALLEELVDGAVKEELIGDLDVAQTSGRTS